MSKRNMGHFDCIKMIVLILYSIDGLRKAEKKPRFWKSRMFEFEHIKIS